jgi:FMN-dependent NADH-azoreductase
VYFIEHNYLSGMNPLHFNQSTGETNMTNILVVNSSPNPDNSTSRALSEQFIENFRDVVPQATVVHRDVGLSPIPHVDQNMVGAYYTPADQRSTEQNEILRLSDTIVDEAEAADIIVIGSPMHNFSITSGLKAWIDHLARVGRTFNYTDKGPVGALGGRKVFVMTARGGSYGEGSPAAAMDMQEPYLRTVLGFVGLDDVTFIHAEGMAGGTAGRDAAEAEIQRIVEDQTVLAA